MNGAFLTGPLYSNVLKKIERARPTGVTTSIKLLQQPVCLVRVCPPMIYHVGLVGTEAGTQKIFEHGPVRYNPHRSLGLLIALPSVWNSLEEIAEFEKTLPPGYLLGYRDCRHHVLDLLEYLYPEYEYPD